MPQAVAGGATAVMVEAGRTSGATGANGAGGIGIVGVADTTKGLQDIAHAVRKASGTTVIAITGSAGKTTTKETMAAFLAGVGRVVKNEGNLNNHIGLPLSLMQLRERPDVAVMELGMNHAGEISALVAIAEPEVRVWTNVGDAHIGFFQSGEAELELVQSHASGDLAVLVMIERQHAEVGGLPDQDWSLRVTQIYRREGTEWRLAHRHADPLVKSISLERAAALARG